VPDKESFRVFLFIMVHGAIPSSYKYNFWAERPGDEPLVVELTCLMPNGVVIPFEINRNITLDQIKEVSVLLSVHTMQTSLLSLRDSSSFPFNSPQMYIYSRTLIALHIAKTPTVPKNKE